MATDRNSVVRDPLLSGGKTVAYTGTAGSTGTWSVGPNSVWVWATTDCYIKVGEGVTATTADFPVPAYTPVVMPVPGGTGAPWRVSAIQISSGGSIYACPLS